MKISCYILSFVLAITLSMQAFAEIKITGNNNVVIISSKNISINGKEHNVAIPLRDLSVDTFPKTIQLNSTRTEKLPPDPRLINDYLAYCDRKEQLPTYRGYLQNEFSGYPRLLSLYTTFFSKNKSRLMITGNPVPLSILNAKLLEVLGRKSDEPLTPSENVSDEKLLNAFIRSWYEKNSN